MVQGNCPETEGLEGSKTSRRRNPKRHIFEGAQDSIFEDFLAWAPRSLVLGTRISNSKRCIGIIRNAPFSRYDPNVVKAGTIVHMKHSSVYIVYTTSGDEVPDKCPNERKNVW